MEEKRTFDDYIDEELKNNEEEDSSIIDELKEELEEIESESETEEDAGASEDELSKCQALLEVRIVFPEGGGRGYLTALFFPAPWPRSAEMRLRRLSR